MRRGGRDRESVEGSICDTALYRLLFFYYKKTEGNHILTFRVILFLVDVNSKSIVWNICLRVALE